MSLQVRQVLRRSILEAVLVAAPGAAWSRRFATPAEVGFTRRFAAKLRYQQTEYPVAPAECRLQTPVNAPVVGTPRLATAM